MNILEIVVASVRGAQVAALVSLFGTLVFLTLVVPSAMTEASKDAPYLRAPVAASQRASAPYSRALIIGIAWLAVETAVIAGADSARDDIARPAGGRVSDPVRSMAAAARRPAARDAAPLRPWHGGNAIAAGLAAITTAVQPMLGHAGAIGGSVGTHTDHIGDHASAGCGAWLGGLLPLFITIGAAAAQCRGNRVPQLHAGWSLRCAGAGRNRRGASGGIHGWPARTVRHRLWPCSTGEAGGLFIVLLGAGRPQSLRAHRAAHWICVRTPRGATCGCLSPPRQCSAPLW